MNSIFINLHTNLIIYFYLIIVSDAITGNIFKQVALSKNFCWLKNWKASLELCVNFLVTLEICDTKLKPYI